MRRLIGVLALAGLLSTPVAAASPRDPVDPRPGVFIGGQLKLSLGGRGRHEPEAALAVAPSHRKISSNGMIATRIGEGFAVKLRRSSKPSLTLAGVPASSALGLKRHGQAEVDRKLGVSSGGWVAIGLGVVVLVAGAYVLYLYDKAEDNSD